jgi:hypothetical protein
MELPFMTKCSLANIVHDQFHALCQFHCSRSLLDFRVVFTFSVGATIDNANFL